MNVGFIQKRKYHRNNPIHGLSKLSSTQVALGINSIILTPKIKPIKKKFNILINWGLSSTKCPWVHEQFTDPNREGRVLINAPWNVENSIDKFLSLSLFNTADVPTISYTTLREDAEKWIEDGNTVFCRTLTKSFQGRGIVIANTIEELVDAPLYTLRFKKKWEYRVHVAFDEPIKVQQKKRLTKEKLEEKGITYSEGLIRSYNNGYIFSSNLEHSEDSEVYQRINQVAIDAVSALDLDFGAVDIGVSKDGEVKVFEVNTAPGIEGSTLDAYISAFKEYINNIN